MIRYMSSTKQAKTKKKTKVVVTGKISVASVNELIARGYIVVIR